MKYHYKYARLPDDKRLLRDINSAAGRLKDKVVDIEVNKLDIEGSSKKYFGDQIKSVDSSLRRFSYILSWALAGNSSSYDELVLIDHGAGVGIMSLLAKEVGIGNVIYNDLYGPYCKDARTIAKAVGNPAWMAARTRAVTIVNCRLPDSG